MFYFPPVAAAVELQEILEHEKGLHHLRSVSLEQRWHSPGLYNYECDENVKFLRPNLQGFKKYTFMDA